MQNKFLYIIIWLIVVMSLSGCATTAVLDVSQRPELQAADTIATPIPVRVEYLEKYIFVEKPVYVPVVYAEHEPVAVSPCTENVVISPCIEEATTGEVTVKQSLTEAVQTPEYWQGGMIEYDYDETFSYQVFTQPLRITDIKLQPGETVLGRPVTGDTTRWIIASGVSSAEGEETQHVYLKPIRAGLETTLIINTNRRRYYLVLQSYTDVYMMGVRWNYPQESLPASFPGKPGSRYPEGPGINLANLHSDYIITYPKKNPPVWLPERVYDDGAKTYILLPAAVLTDVMPALSGKNGEVLNFRVQGNTLVLDRLIAEIRLKLENVTILIRKKGQA